MAFVQLVTFEIANNEYAVAIDSISSIIKRRDYSMHKLPGSSSLVEGVINLRGKVCIVFNLAKKFQLESTTAENDLKIIVVQNDTAIVGFIVDEVTDIYKLRDDEIEPLPFSSAGVGSELIQGIAKVEGKIILILNLLKVLTSDEMIDISSVLEKT